MCMDINKNYDIKLNQIMYIHHLSYLFFKDGDL
jgi:hypothetical protein